MLQIFIILFGLIIPNLSQAQIVKPDGFFEFKKVTGDLNNDKSEDAVVIFINCKSGECDEKPEEVKVITRIYLSKNKKLILTQSSEGVVCFRCGGIKGDIFVGDPEIRKNGILNISYEGGSRWTWTHELKWRMDSNEKLKLIGSSTNSIDTLIEPGNWAEDSIGEKVSSDVNYNTKKANLEFINKELKLKKVKCKLNGDYKTPDFDNFKFENFNDGTSNCPKT